MITILTSKDLIARFKDKNPVTLQYFKTKCSDSIERSHLVLFYEGNDEGCDTFKILKNNDGSLGYMTPKNLASLLNSKIQ